MEPKRALRPLRMALVAAGLLASLGSAEASSYSYDFETGTVSPWVAVADPGIPSFSLSAVVGTNLCPSGGSFASRLQAGPNFMPYSALWQYARFPVAPSTTPYTVMLTWTTRNQSNCSTCRAIAYAADGWISSSSPFVGVGPLSSAWTSFSQTFTVTSTTGAIGVALGWKGVADIPGNTTNVNLDCVRVTITP